MSVRESLIETLNQAYPNGVAVIPWGEGRAHHHNISWDNFSELILCDTLFAEYARRMLMKAEAWDDICMPSSDPLRPKCGATLSVHPDIASVELPSRTEICFHSGVSPIRLPSV